jgi:uncharacterized protein YbbC (DUF1343 family)
MKLHISICFFLFVLFSNISLLSCDQAQSQNTETITNDVPNVIPGAERMRKYIPKLEGKNVGLVVNHTSIVNKKHLADTLLDFEINITKIFAPEHGFRGTADAGAKIKDGVDPKTGLPVYSLYGKTKKPSPEMMENIDIMVFDIQDVGCRFYTYISTLTLVMEACAQKGIPLIVLDRPNPNGHYVDGPVLKKGYESFVGMHEIPVVYGLTIGEYGKMVNGEKWLEGGIQCDYEVIELLNYDHSKSEALPIAPSPNLPTYNSVLMYPWLCFFEGTVVSVGRGTDKPFEQYGHPEYSDKTYSFTPKSGPGSKFPKLENKVCYGVDFSTKNPRYTYSLASFNMDYIVDVYNDLALDEEFFMKNNFIDKLYGSDQIRKDLLAGKSAQEIKDSWSDDLIEYKLMSAKYFLYD